MSTWVRSSLHMHAYCAVIDLQAAHLIENTSAGLLIPDCEDIVDIGMQTSPDVCVVTEQGLEGFLFRL